MPKKKPQDGKPQVNSALEGYEIRINEFGEIISSIPFDQLTKFLDQNVEDKKLRERETNPEGYLENKPVKAKSNRKRKSKPKPKHKTLEAEISQSNEPETHTDTN
ncbi:MAG: hypothetical protein IPI59_09115 [Sphingobacteriales bacterium]|jgi:hypothetical protein|nr:hypothetical protein [Sphingobacteriales bacterium]MBP9141829.1 hypothetical protein [Chitinophagales bacterium]MDA0199532.1 hypothetical protein [Bacteroidota bacterium]MBK6889791.1 hypothetical protein [Sphingobacteriales bacterium]MBK7527693.1 hypothetical protein [Sphingobacteriales bacterium]